MSNTDRAFARQATAELIRATVEAVDRRIFTKRQALRILEREGLDVRGHGSGDLPAVGQLHQ